MTLHADIMNIPCLPIAGTELEILAFRLGHMQAIQVAAELVERAAQQEINSALDDDEPASLSKAMAYLESKAAQARREQKLRDEVEALRKALRKALRRCLDEDDEKEGRSLASLATILERNAMTIEALAARPWRNGDQTGVAMMEVKAQIDAVANAMRKWK